MATKLVGVLSSFTLLISFSCAFSTDDINQWCNQTPNPEPCKYFMTHGSHHFAPNHKTEFKKMAMQVAMERAVRAKTHHKELISSKCQTERQKNAMADCLKLYESTVFHLNQTLTQEECLLKKTSHWNNQEECYSDSDAQTWLSAALTNLDTCRAGLVELGVSDSLLPLMSNNVSKLISNSLALHHNNGSSRKQVHRKMTQHYGTEVVYSKGFPTWVSAGDRRKLLQTSRTTTRADLVVAQDGSGDYRTVTSALDAAAKRSGIGRFVIHVKRGVYRENIEIGISMKNIMLVGDGMKYTIITGSRSVGGGYTSYNSATVAVAGAAFIAHGITFRNTAGPQNAQAVAVRSDSDRSVFYRCGFEGYQDTLFVHTQRQFYKECYIYGTVDFIFGNAAVVFQNCMIIARKPITGQQNVITAQGRNDPYQNTGISIQGCRVMAAPELRPVVGSVKTYLGRPWKKYSRTVYLRTYIGSLVDPKGWLEWEGTNFAVDSVYYGEYRNFGPGSSTGGRVRWGGYYKITSAIEAARFSVASFIAGGAWLPATSVPYTTGI